MRQRDLFPGYGGIEEFDVPDAELRLDRRFLTVAEADAAFDALRADTPWEQERTMMYGREVRSPRLTAWFGDPGASYTYSGVHHEAREWTATLAGLRGRVEAATGHRFNSVLLNLYRDGMDSVAWHSDDEPELGRQPVIGSVSLGAARVFQLKHGQRADVPRVDIELTHGSLLLMGGGTQRCWRHQIPKRRGARAPGPRINLTFRLVLSEVPD